jgi:hypothetical protein
LTALLQEVRGLLRGRRPVPAGDHAEDLRITRMQDERRSPVAGYRLLDIGLYGFMM